MAVHIRRLHSDKCSVVGPDLDPVDNVLNDIDVVACDGLATDPDHCISPFAALQAGKRKSGSNC